MRKILRSTLLFALATPLVVMAAESTPVTIQDGEQSFTGDLFYPKGAKGPLPIVVVVHEWWGKTEYPLARGKRIADELGYAALVVDLFGKIATTPTDAQALAGPFYATPLMGVNRLNLFIAAVPEAAQRAGIQIDAKKWAAIGYCFGGSQALNLGRSAGTLPEGTHLSAVAAFHAGLTSTLKAPAKMEPRVLVLHGAADPMVKPEEVTAFKEEMKLSGADLKFVEYKGAKHAFTNPKATEIGKKYGIPIAYNKAADQGSWKELKTFLRLSYLK